MRFLWIYILILFTSNTIAQTETDTPPDHAKNAFYISGEFYPLFLTLHYERNLLTTDFGTVRYVNAQLSSGLWVMASAGGYGCGLALNTLSVTGTHHLDIMAGMDYLYGCFGCIIIDPSTGESSGCERSGIFMPRASVGYRYHPPTGGLMLRIGFGFPFIQVGLGYCF